jgi:uncharacterized damage-inducible protein DinB
MLAAVTAPDAKQVLHRYLQTARHALLWKLDGLSDYDVRRPMTPTGTNLLGLVKHLSCAEAAYFGAVFGRPFPEPLAWDEEDGDANADMWAAADESRDQILALYHRARAHADATIGALDLDAAGRVPHWPKDRRDVTLQTMLVHVLSETQRHAGHADIVRELIDGSVGLRAGSDSMPSGDRAWWAAYVERLERVAREAGGGSPGDEEGPGQQR